MQYTLRRTRHGLPFMHSPCRSHADLASQRPKAGPPTEACNGGTWWLQTARLYMCTWLLMWDTRWWYKRARGPGMCTCKCTMEHPGVRWEHSPKGFQYSNHIGSPRWKTGSCFVREGGLVFAFLASRHTGEEFRPICRGRGKACKFKLFRQLNDTMDSLSSAGGRPSHRSGHSTVQKGYLLCQRVKPRSSGQGLL